VLAFVPVSAAPADGAGTVMSVTGTVVARAPTGVSRILGQRSELQEGELIATAADSYVRIRFQDGGEVSLRPNTQMRIDRYAYRQDKPESDSVFMSLIKGGLRALTGQIARRSPGAFRMDAVTATIGIRGTHYGVQLCQDDCVGLKRKDGRPLPNGLHIDIEDGCTIVATDVDKRSYCQGEFGYVSARNAPPLPVPPEEGFRVSVPATFVPGSPLEGLRPSDPGAQECVI
jgi:hypothetical protein